MCSCPEDHKKVGWNEAALDPRGATHPHTLAAYDVLYQEKDKYILLSSPIEIPYLYSPHGWHITWGTCDFNNWKLPILSNNTKTILLLYGCCYVVQTTSKGIHRTYECDYLRGCCSVSKHRRGRQTWASEPWWQGHHMGCGNCTWGCTERQCPPLGTLLGHPPAIPLESPHSPLRMAKIRGRNYLTVYNICKQPIFFLFCCGW